MKTATIILATLSFICFSCANPQEEVIPTQAEKYQTCHLQSEAIVEYSELGHEDGTTERFYYLALLEDGKRGDDVYAGKLPEAFQEVGKKVEVVYHVNPQGDFVYISACGNGPGFEPVMESMKSIVVCNIGQGLF